MMLTDLADVLRSAGLRVVEVSGWKTRSADGNRFVGVWGILCHWTATNPAAAGDYPTLNTILNGNGSTPGPLSQLGLGRDGTWYVIAAGVCWHAGAVDRVASDNYHAIAVEAEYHPNQGAWPEVQQRSYERGVAALQQHYRVPLAEVRGHYEAAIPYGRKDDPRTLPGGMPGFRQRVGAVNLQEDGVSANDVTTGLYNTRVEGRNVFDWFVQLRHEQGIYMSKILDAVLSRGDVDTKAIIQGVVAALPSQLQRFSDAELQRISTAAADEMDRRARDGDPHTGPTS